MQKTCMTCKAVKNVPRKWPIQPAFAYCVKGTTYKGHPIYLAGQGTVRNDVKSAAYAIHKTPSGDMFPRWIAATRIPDRLMPDAMNEDMGELAPESN